MGKGGQNSANPARKISLEELGKHRLPGDGKIPLLTLKCTCSDNVLGSQLGCLLKEKSMT